MSFQHVENASKEQIVRSRLISDTYKRSTFEIGSINWVHWYLSLPGNEFLLEIPRTFLEDDFNFSGLGLLIPLFKEALGILLGITPEHGYSVEDLNLIEASIEQLYSLLHQRYVISRSGLLQMKRRYIRGEFGFCQRYYCHEAPLLPCGTFDSYGVDSVKMYCANCLDLYNPTSSRFLRLDGACFGTTFSHLFFLTLLPTDSVHCSSEVYIPKIHGFRIHETNFAGHRNSWLRQKIVDDNESDRCESEKEENEVLSLPLSSKRSELTKIANLKLKQADNVQFVQVKTSLPRSDFINVHFKRLAKSEQAVRNNNYNRSSNLCLVS